MYGNWKKFTDIKLLIIKRLHIPFVKLSTSFILLTLNIWIALLFTTSLYRNQKQKLFHSKKLAL